MSAYLCLYVSVHRCGASDSEGRAVEWFVAKVNVVYLCEAVSVCEKEKTD